MKIPTITVLIVTYNSSDYIADCLRSVELNKHKSYSLKIIISDNNSSDSTVKIISDKFPEVKILQNGENLGFAGGINRAIANALQTDSEFFFILNPDTKLNPTTVYNLYKYRNLADILSPKIYFTHDPKVIWYAGGKIDWENCLGSHIGVDQKDSGQFDKIYDIDYSTGCAELIKRQVFEKTGLMDEKYFLYLEDLDFSIRVKKNSFKIKFIPYSTLFHHNAQSSGVGSPVQDYFITRNRIYFAIKYASFRTKFAVLRQSLGFLFNGRDAQKWAVKDFFLGKMYKGTIFKHL